MSDLEVNADEIKTYAVLTSEGDLVFFNSYEEHANNVKVTVTDIKGNEYTGTVYTGVENTGTSTPPWYSKRSSIKKVYVAEDSVIRPTSMYKWFYDANNLKSFDGEGFDTSKVTSMSFIFYNCSLLTSLNLSSFDTSNVTNMGYMFDLL